MDKKYKNSLYHFVVNTNTSNYVYEQMDRSKKEAFVGRLISGVGKLKSDINSYTKNKDVISNVKTFQANLEVGPLRKFIHVDGIIELDNYNMLDYPSIRKMLNTEMGEYSKGVHLDVKYVHDNRATVEEYANKDGLRLI
jgi:hypothetical protein